ncbi:dihydrodipicolinate synthase family protein [Nocardia sp. BMG111209]|uniref:dihydrodipicolinate synthase family protein n=1 Tax=Nocardia sp. BMG111209 TaxID=1160137 RepID=UPI000366B418|nr:dihydrodipicolinate synthase family protein [Nocardia sp. BMG111209]
MKLEAVIPPLVTPLDAAGELDRRSLERLITRQLAAGVHGVFVGGSSGEVALLDTAQRRDLVATTVAVVAGAVPVLAGAVDTGTRRVVEQARQAADLGADAVVVTAPFYIQPHPDEVLAHFRRIHAAVDIPVIAYDIPAAVGTPLSPDLVTALAESETIVALKDSSGDLAKFREVLRRTDLPAFSGSELFADTAVELGAAGIVPGLGNVDPDGYVRLYRAARAGDTAAARAEQDRLAGLFRIVTVADRSRIGFTAGALGAFKAAMTLLGILDCAAVNPPLAPLSEAEIRSIAEILATHGLEPINRP